MSASFDRLKAEILNCHRCTLSKTRNHVIFGEGNPNAEIFIIGEGPGKVEDLKGRPFVGPSGQLLDKILAVCGFSREKHVFISNIVKCRPPNNRIPAIEETQACLPWLYEQLEMVDPKIIVLLGATALKNMAGNHHRITREHGQWLTVRNRLAMPVYHPSALLRDPRLKRPTWEDYKNIVRKYRQMVDRDHFSSFIRE